MLNVFSRCAAPWACAWMLGLPAAHAATPVAPGQEAVAPLERYQGWRDEPLRDWRSANEHVGEIGGWRTYLREAQPEAHDGGSDGRGGHGHPYPDQSGSRP